MVEKIETRLGHLLRLDRRLRGEGVRAAAKRFGMSPTTYCKFENSEKLAPPLFLKMMEYLLAPMPPDDNPKEGK